MALLVHNDLDLNFASQVQELKGQVEGIQLGSRADFNLEDEFMASSAMSSASSRRSYGMDERQKEQLRRMDRERKETNEVRKGRAWKFCEECL